jgi:alpha-beta hydrolase superfamily lysophospholipase
MATIVLEEDRLKLRLTTAEKLLGLHGDIDVPLAAVHDARVEPDAVAAASGLRAAGLTIPGRVKIGTGHRRGRRRFVSARAGVPAVRVRLTGQAMVDLLVSTPHAPAVAEAVRELLGVGTDPLTATREIQVTVPSEGLRLTGTLTVPRGQGPHPGAVILPGSGPLDRDANHRRMPLGVSRDLARALAERGVASLRYDKRGVGASQGSWRSAGFTDNIWDAKAALTWLQARSEVRVGASFLIGHSEGAYLAAGLGGDPVTRGLAGAVLLAGSASRGQDAMAWQVRQIAHGLPSGIRIGLRMLHLDPVESHARRMAKIRSTSGDVARIAGRKVNARWYREMLAFDPKPGLAQIHAPVLAITGSKDLQVDPDELSIIAVTVAGPVQTIRVPDLTHVLRRDSGKPTVAAYRKLLREPTDPVVLEAVVDWVAQRSQGSG